MQMPNIPTPGQIKDNATKVSLHIRKTPVLPWESGIKNELIGKNTEVIFKCELFQKTGTFKLRGALTRIMRLSEEEKKRGVVAGTGGNHGIALAYAAQLDGVHAKIVIPKTIMDLFRNGISIPISWV